MKMTINIDDDLLEELKRRTEVEKQPFQKTLEAVLQRGLAAPPAAKPVQIDPAPIGVKAPYQHLSMNLL